MTKPTDRPPAPQKRWAIAIRTRGGSWWVNGWTVRRTRSDAIKAYDELWDGPHYGYADSRQRGEVRAVRVTVTAEWGGEE